MSNDAEKEIDRLTRCLSIANSQSEEFERKHYLQMDEIESLRAERDALQSKIASASVIVYGRDCDCASESGGIHEPLIGTRVALVPLD